MSIEALIWGILPSIVAFACVILSAVIAIRARRPLQSLLSVAAVTLDGLALWLLFAIFVLGSWPTFIPHILIGVSVLVLLLQTFSYWRHR